MTSDLKNHKMFVPSIKSEITKVDKKKYILSSLRERTIYEFNLKDLKYIEDFKQIYTNERIRDLIYREKDNKIFLFLEDTASIGVIDF